MSCLLTTPTPRVSFSALAVDTHQAQVLPPAVQASESLSRLIYGMGYASRRRDIKCDYRRYLACTCGRSGFAFRAGRNVDLERSIPTQETCRAAIIS